MDRLHAYMPMYIHTPDTRRPGSEGRWRQRDEGKVSRRVGTLADETIVVLRACWVVPSIGPHEASTRVCGVGNRCAGRGEHHGGRANQRTRIYMYIHMYIHTCTVNSREKTTTCNDLTQGADVEAPCPRTKAPSLQIPSL